MNPIAIILAASAAVVGATGLAVLPPDSAMVPTTAYVYVDEDPPMVPSETRPEAPETTIPLDRGICPPIYDTAVLVGFTPDQAAILDEIAYFESRCNALARGDLTKGVSWGILQIHGPSWCEANRYWPDGYLQAMRIVETCEDLLDPTIAVVAAYLIHKEGGFQQWSTYELVVGE
jgi:hypothetical protein